MEPSSKLRQQTHSKTKSNLEKLKLIVMDKSSKEANLHRPLKTSNRLFKIVVSFLTG